VRSGRGKIPAFNNRMPQTIAVIGAGELGATLARRLAAAELFRRVLLLDPDAGRAKGKALDILQSGPVEGFDTRVEGGPLEDLGEVDAVALADPPALEAGHLPSEAAEVLDRIRAAAGRAPLVVAGGHPGVVEMAVEKGHPRERVVGSGPVAIASALRWHLALALEGRPRDVAATVLGRPPDRLLIPRGTALVGGLPVDRLSPSAARTALSRVAGRWPGPVALAAAAVRVLEALWSADASVLPVLVVLAGEYGHRGRALAVPARLGRGRVLGVVELELDPVDRVAFDNAAGGR
jgi:malate dehydrogenase